MADSPYAGLIWKKPTGWTGGVPTYSAKFREHSFTADKPYASGWVLRGWTNGTFKVYREAGTLKELKAIADTIMKQRYPG